MSYIDEIKQILPEKLLVVSYTSPPEIGELTWYFSDFKKVLTCLHENKRIILGGDVYKLKGEKLDSTWHYWNYNIEKELSYQENVDKSYKVAIESIEYLNKKLGKDFLYSVGIKTEN
jgi:hypothetical protein